jgi:hypothetical protein
METDGVTTGLTVIVIPLETDNTGVAHASEVVISHVTTLLFASDDVVNVGEFVPAFTPLTFH